MNAVMIHVIGSTRHTPRYPSIGAIINAAMNFPASSVKLAARGMIFLPIPCRLFLITRRMLRIK